MLRFICSILFWYAAGDSELLDVREMMCGDRRGIVHEPLGMINDHP